MIRQRLSRRQDSFFVCAHCRTACGKLRPQPTSHRWYSSNNQPPTPNAATSSRTGPGIARPAYGGGASFGRPAFGKPSFGQRTAGPAPKKQDEPALEDDDDEDFLLPHEMAVRTRAAEREAAARAQAREAAVAKRKALGITPEKPFEIKRLDLSKPFAGNEPPTPVKSDRLPKPGQEAPRITPQEQKLPTREEGMTGDNILRPETVGVSATEPLKSENAATKEESTSSAPPTTPQAQELAKEPEPVTAQEDKAGDDVLRAEAVGVGATVSLKSEYSAAKEESISPAPSITLQERVPATREGEKGDSVPRVEALDVGAKSPESAATKEESTSSALQERLKRTQEAKPHHSPKIRPPTAPTATPQPRNVGRNRSSLFSQRPRMPLLEDDDDDILLPHELAARASSARLLKPAPPLASSLGGRTTFGGSQTLKPSDTVNPKTPTSVLDHFPSFGAPSAQPSSRQGGLASLLSPQSGRAANGSQPPIRGRQSDLLIKSENVSGSRQDTESLDQEDSLPAWNQLHKRAFQDGPLPESSTPGSDFGFGSFILGSSGSSRHQKNSPARKASLRHAEESKSSSRSKTNSKRDDGPIDKDFAAKFGQHGKPEPAPPKLTGQGEWDWVEDVEKKIEKEAKAEALDSRLRLSEQSEQAEPIVAPAFIPEEYDVVEDRWSRKKGSRDQDRDKVRGRDRESVHQERDDKKKPRMARRRPGDVDADNYDEERAEARRLRKEERRLQKEREEQEKLAAGAATKAILLPEFITVANLGEALGSKPSVFLDELLQMGFEDITVESVMTGETAALVAQEYGFEPTIDAGDQVDLKPRPPPEDPTSLPPRPPIVTIMGHVDHGKTSMLDWLRKSSIAAGEHGGITQHIGAFSVKMSNGRQITFLDTPGHAAFLTMRQRGANITDIVILVVAADDSVKPQTLEALKHARAAKVPIIVAINKIDRPEARVDQVKADLANSGVELEDFGGDVQVVCVSAITGQGMDDLEENLVALAEMLDMRAEHDGMAEGWILESSIKQQHGRAASVLVKRGTLHKGDLVVAGTSFARVRFMLDEAGQEVDEAPPGTPVEVFGWRGTPSAGDLVLQAPDEDRVKDVIRYREEIAAWEKTAADVTAQEKAEREKAAAEAEKAEKEREEELRADLGEPAGPEEDSTPGMTMVNFLVKGDVMGSVEAVHGAVMEIGNNEVRPQILRSAPGQVTESDVEHAETTGSYIINFNGIIAPGIQRMAEQKGVKILDHSIIYHLVDDVKAVLSERLTPNIVQKVNGEAEVLQLFPIKVKGRKTKNIAGCKVRTGVLSKNNLYRVLRGTPNPVEVHKGKLEALRHVKKDISEAKKGTECGIQFEDWDDLRVGDKIQAYEEGEEKRHL